MGESHSAAMRALLLLMLVAAAASEVANIDCEQAEAANDAVCSAYGYQSALCVAAQAHIAAQAHCQLELGEDSGAFSRDVTEIAAGSGIATTNATAPSNKTSAPTKPKKPVKKEAPKKEAPKKKANTYKGPKIKEFLAPILQSCGRAFEAHKADCKTKVQKGISEYRAARDKHNDELKKKREEDAKRRQEEGARQTAQMQADQAAAAKKATEQKAAQEAAQRAKQQNTTKTGNATQASDEELADSVYTEPFGDEVHMLDATALTL